MPWLRLVRRSHSGFVGPSIRRSTGRDEFGRSNGELGRGIVCSEKPQCPSLATSMQVETGRPTSNANENLTSVWVWVSACPFWGPWGKPQWLPRLGQYLRVQADFLFGNRNGACTTSRPLGFRSPIHALGERAQCPPWPQACKWRQGDQQAMRRRT